MTNPAPRIPAAARLALLLAALAPGSAFAYVGPGSGVTLIGALIAILVAVGLTLLGLLIWPIRALLRWLKKRRTPGTEGTATPPAPAEDPPATDA